MENCSKSNNRVGWKNAEKLNDSADLINGASSILHDVIWYGTTRLSISGYFSNLFTKQDNKTFFIGFVNLTRNLRFSCKHRRKAKEIFTLLSKNITK